MSCGSSVGKIARAASQRAVPDRARTTLIAIEGMPSSVPSIAAAQVPE